MQGLEPGLQVLLVLLVPLRDAGVEIPAVVVEAGLAGERFNLGAGFFLDVGKADDHIGNLHAGVVDVVLNVDFPARVTQQADKAVAENGISQVSDVRRFVGIDAGVLDQNLSGRNVGRRLLVSSEGSGHPGAVDSYVEVARAGDLHFADTLDRAYFAPDLLGNSQGGGAQRLSKGENRDGKVA